MRLKLEFTEPYLIELNAIIDHVELNFSPRVSKAVKQRLNESVQMLTVFPRLGVRIGNAQRPNIRKLIVSGKSIVFYEVRQGTIRLLNIYDSRMDWMRRT